MSSHEMREVRVPGATMWTAPDAPRDVDRPALLDEPNLDSWLTATDAVTRSDLDGRTLTQLLMGEPVQVLEESDGWVRCRAPWQPSSLDEHGYPGWVRRAHLGSPVSRTDGATAFVTALSADCGTEDGFAYSLSLGTALWVDRVDARKATVLLPGGRRGTVRLEDVRLSDKREQPACSPADLLATARGFLGLRYLWGGTGRWGLDCSGLVLLTCRVHGVLFPRDAHDQAEHTAPVPLDEVEPGDLYFFARPGAEVYHVGLVSRPVAADGIRWMLHAPEVGGLVEDAELAPHRQEMLSSAGRVSRP